MKKALIYLVSITLFSFWLYWDISEARKELPSKCYFISQDINAVTSATAKVALVRSDNDFLDTPAPPHESLTYQQVEGMVRLAVKEAGTFDWLIHAGDRVLLKPNIVEREVPGCGEITDVRVIKALIKIINDIAPGRIEIVVGEGSPRPMDYEVPYSIRFKSAIWQELWDTPGYQDLLADPDLEGINFRLSNLNGSPPEDPWQDLVPISIQNGGMATPHENAYYVHKDVLNADVFITVPVLKSHKVGMTCALKNQIGIAPSTKYGFSKTGGVPQDGYAFKLIHRDEAYKDWVDEEIVDFSTIADIDFCLVDAISCLESSKEAIWNNGVVQNKIRLNCILAGSDPVAVDHVCCRLMGLNPDDMAFITLAEKIGLGTNNPNDISIKGDSLDSLVHPFKKESFYTSDYGQSNREWLISPAFSIDQIENPIDHLFLQNEASIAPIPGQAGWSKSLFFVDDRIDLEGYYQSSDDKVSYAFCYFDAPRDQTAELWVGSDEAVKIWINDQVAYQFNGNRTFGKVQLVSERVSVPIKAGENRLLVKTLQRYGTHHFSLNLCESESNPQYDGNRVWGLTFKTTSSRPTVQLTLPEFTVIQGRTVNFPLQTADLTRYDITSITLSLLYDPSVIEFVGLEPTGMCPVQWSGVSCSLSEPGQLTVTALGDFPLQGRGELMSFRFDVIGDPGDQTDVTIENIAFNQGSPIPVVSPGRINVHIPTLSIVPHSLDINGIGPGESTPIELLCFNTDSGKVRWKSMSVTNTGTCLDEDVESINIYMDNGDETFNAQTDTFIAQSCLLNDRVNFDFDPMLNLEPSVGSYWIVIQSAQTLSDHGVKCILTWNRDDFRFDHPVYVDALFPFHSFELSLPVQLKHFTARRFADGVRISWVALDETAILGYSIEKQRDDQPFFQVAFINSSDDPVREKRYTYVDNTTGKHNVYRLKIVALDGTFSYSDPKAVVGDIPQDYRIHCYPNPFNHRMTVQLTCDEAIRNVDVYNIEGKFIKTLNSGSEKGARKSFEWDATDSRGLTVATGVYVIKARIKDMSIIEKIVFGK